MKKQLLLLGFALGLSSTAIAANYSVTTSNGSACTQNEETAATMEFGTELDTITQQGKVFAKWVFKIGQEDLTKIDCSLMYANEVERQTLELERLKMEIKMLKSQLNPTLPASGDDW